MFEIMTYDTIMERMLDKVPDDLDKREGSVIWDALSPAALELELAYIALEYILIEGFADTCDREHLILRARERGIEAEEATPAILKGVFSPVNLDLTGQRFNLGKLNYTVTKPVTGESGAWQLECETAGTEGNSLFGDLIPIDYIEGLESAEATEVLIPGEDEEETEVLRQRYFNSFNAKSYGGNVRDYIEKTNSINGVGATKVIPIWNGGGTVKLIILNSDFDRASNTLIETVQETIDPPPQGTGLGVAPIGHTVTVVTASEVSINIKTNLEFATGYSWENLQSAIEDALNEYLLSLRKEWANTKNTTVRLSQIESRLMGIEGIVDITETTINNQERNLILDNDQIPVLGGVGDVTT